uniref:uncharacterized protein LOC100184498 isoform X1 n=1 Tax=Ciona intestinalis TaxID=7719 RepID=UPI0002B8D821|nr:uncharacterized protein LOC100184498 isoform X1 [Ciona intestinalis]XP_009861048.1 uncharacterized protein LOC100184498 isoform X2 [Ciona intestinalis]|eukprot:XP_002124539.2 uncharacterized protein LOC100184498 isoform X1 [Ciona intestinalis]
MKEQQQQSTVMMKGMATKMATWKVLFWCIFIIDLFCCNGEKKCPQLKNPANGLVSVNNSKVLSDWSSGAIAKYYCEEEFMLIPNVPVRSCFQGKWSGQTPKCVSHTRMCRPPEQINAGSFYPVQLYYSVGSLVTYRCNVVQDGTKVTTATVCMDNLKWSNKPPVCFIESTLPVLNFCSKPPALENGEIFCCLPNAESTGRCCPTGSSVQFSCDIGYKLVSNKPEWTCNAIGHWNEDVTTYSNFPRCVTDEFTSPPKLNVVSYNDEMVHTVLGVSAGVLCLLLIVITLAFCRPRLKNIKFRSHDMREDQNALLINGQRISLPTYAEATTCQQIVCGQQENIEILNSLSPPSMDNIESTQPEANNGSSEAASTAVYNTDNQIQNLSLSDIDSENGHQANHSVGETLQSRDAVQNMYLAEVNTCQCRDNYESDHEPLLLTTCNQHSSMFNYHQSCEANVIVHGIINHSKEPELNENDEYQISQQSDFPSSNIDNFNINIDSAGDTSFVEHNEHFLTDSTTV